MIKYLSNGGLSKTAAILFQFIVGLGASYVCGTEILHGLPINPYCAAIVAGILGHQITIYSGAIVSDTAKNTATNAVNLLEAQPPKVGD